MDKERIESVICEILKNEGPDGHIDGSDMIADFIMWLLKDEGEKWIDSYLYLHRNDRLTFIERRK